MSNYEMMSTEEMEIKRDDGINETLAGKVHGERWARKHATLENLKAFWKVNQEIFFIDPLYKVYSEALDDEEPAEHFWDWLIDDPTPSDEFVLAFVKAALEVFAEAEK